MAEAMAYTERGKSMKKLLIIVCLLALFSSNEANAQVTCTNCGTEVTQLLNNIQMVKQVITSAQQLQAELNMYKNMLTNSESVPNHIWGKAMQDITKVNALLQQSQAIAHTSGNIDDQYANKYSTYKNYLAKQMNGQDWDDKYDQWSKETSDNMLYTMKALGLQSTQMDDDDAVMQQLQTLSQSSEGRMQALQVGNMMAAQSMRQLQKLEKLMMINTQMQANYLATQQDKEAAIDAARQKFLEFKRLPNNDGRRF